MNPESDLPKTNTEHLIDVNNRYNLVFEHTKIGLWDWNLVTNKVYYNPSYFKMLGYEENELGSDHHSWLDLIHPEDREETIKSAFDSIRKAQDYELEFRMKNKSGDYIWIQSRAKVAEVSHKNEVQRLIGSHIDISKQKNAELKLNQTKHKLAESKRIWEFAIESNRDGVWDWNLQTNTVFYSKQWAQMLQFDQNELKNTIQQWKDLCHPQDRESMMAAIDKHIEGNSQYFKQIHRLKCKAGTYKWFLGRGRLLYDELTGKPSHFIGTHTDIDDRVQNELQQKKLSAYQLAIINSGQTSVWAIDNEYNVLFCNSHYRESIKRLINKDVIIGNSLFDHLPANLYRDQVKGFCDRALAGEKFFEEIETYNHKGISKWAEISFSPIEVEGIITGSVISAKDITEKKLLEKERAHHLQQLQVLNSNIKDLISIINPNGVYMWVSPSCEDLIEYQPHQMVGKNFFDFIHKEDLQLIKEEISAVAATKSTKSFRIEHRMFDKSGNIKWFESLTKASYNDNGVLEYFQSSSRDITEKKIANTELRINETRLKLAIQGAKEGIWDWNIANNYVFYNTEFSDMLEYTGEELKPDIKTWQKIAHPDDFVDVVKSIIQHLKGHTEYFQSEHRLRSKSGQYRWFTAHGKIAERNAEGKPIRMLGTLVDVDKFKKTQIALEISENKFRKLYQHTPIMLNSLDSGGVIVHVNDFWLENLGYEINEVVGKNFTSFCIHTSESKKQKLKNQLILDGIQDLPMQIRGKKGAVKDVLLSSIKLKKEDGSFDNTLIVIKDVTKQKKTETLLLQTLKKLEEYKLSLDKHSLVSISDRNGTLLYVNQKLCEISGYQKEELLGKDNRIFSSNYHDKNFFKTLWTTIQSGKVWQGEIRNQSKNGANYWVDTTIVPFKDESNAIYQYIAIYTDISNKKNNEIQLVELNNELQDQVDKLNEYNFITSHNLRAPLASILGLLDILNPEDDADTIRENKKFLSQAANNLDQIIKDLNSIISSDRDKHKSFVPVNIASSLEKVKDSLSSHVQSTSTKLMIDVNPNLEIMGQPYYFNSIFQNLIENAIKYRNADRIPEVKVYTEEMNDMVKIVISDNGIGFDYEKNKKNLFRLYKRFHNNADGKGIGLHLVKKQVDAMHGQIDVDSTPGVGTSFELYFRQRPVDITKLDSILLIDDDTLNNMINERIIRHTNNSVEINSFTDAEIALKALDNQQIVPNMILLDINMPLMNGWDFLDIFQKTEIAKRSDCKLFLLSSSLDASDKEMAERYESVKGFITKPLSIEIFKSICNEHYN